MRLLIIVLALFGAFIGVAMLVAPSQPVMRDWYQANACPLLDKLSTDICASIRRAADGKTL